MIYILDYDTDVAFAVNEWLQMNGFKTKSFTTLEQLLQNLKVQHPGCMLLDCKFGKQSLLPGICRTIRNEFNYTGSIIITHTSDISGKYVKQSSANGFMTKPYDFDCMIDVINDQLGDLEQRCAA